MPRAGAASNSSPSAEVKERVDAEILRMLSRRKEAGECIEQDVAVRAGLSHYVLALVRWNRVYRLTGTQDPVALVRRHVADCLSPRSSLQGDRLLDVGTGAGLPGLVLAIVEPQRHWTLLDSSAKRTRFCRQIVAELGLRSVEVVQERVEEFHPPRAFSTIISRAVMRVSQLAVAAHGMMADEGVILAMKGSRAAAELAADRQALTELGLTARISPLVVPDLDEKRNLIVCSRVVSCTPSPRLLR